jgi:hypothetical protein
MGKYYGVPETWQGAVGAISGIVAVALWSTQYFFDWFGATTFDKNFYNILVLVLISVAIGFNFVGNRLANNRKRLTASKDPTYIALRNTFLILIGVFLYIIVVNGWAMTMSTEYVTYADGKNGIWTGISRLDSRITKEDVGDLENFALGIAQLSRSMFLIVPCLIGTWGGLSVLTADSVDEAEGGILAILAAMVVFFIAWIFKGINVSLMPSMLTMFQALGDTITMLESFRTPNPTFMSALACA